MEDARKKCHRCHEEKPLLEFNKCKTGMLGLHNHCRLCQKLVRRQWYLNNQKIQLEKGAEFSQSEAGKAWRKNNWQKRKNELGPKQNARRKLEPAKAKARIQRAAWLAIPHNRIANSLRARLRATIRKGSKSLSTEALLSCSYEVAKNHLEEQFAAGMSWDNYGDWHIDHIIPCGHFDLTDIEQQYICFHYLNLRPLWAAENISKHDKLFPELYCETLAKIKAARNSGGFI